MPKVEFLNLKKHNEQVFSEVLERIKETCENSNFILGPAVQEFEESFAEYVGTKYAVAVNSGTAALHLALLSLGIKEGDEVITTPYTFFATVEAILCCGAKPIFVDIDSETFNIDVEKIEEKINSKTRAILPIHLYGQSSEMGKILELARKYNLKVVEDACQAHGAEYNNKKVGSIGDIGCFSFYPTKNLSGWGDGGIVTTSSEELTEKIKKFRNHGSKIRYEHEILGFNERMDGIQGAVLGVKLKYLDGWNAKRRRRAAFYNELLKDAPIILPAEKHKHVYHLYTIKTSRRDELKKFLDEKGIETAIHYQLPLHLQNACKNFGYGLGDFPNAERSSNEVLSLPLNPELTREEIKFVAENIKNFFETIKPKIRCSVPILTLNSEKYLERCLSSVKDFDEIIIMDGNSTDKTLEIARKYNAKIYKQFETNEPNQKIKNFTEMRLKLWSKINNSWFLLLDSDEFITPELAEEIKEVIRRDEKDVVYKVPTHQILNNGKIVKYSFASPYYLRLLRNDIGITLKSKIVHEKVKIPDGIKDCLAENYLLTDLPSNKECVEKDKHYLKLTIDNAHKLNFRQCLRKALINFAKGTYIGFKSCKIYLKYGFRESLPPRYVWRFMKYHYLISFGLLKNKIKRM